MIHHTDADVTLLCGDAVEQLSTLDADSVQCVVTSPPYYGLRDYGHDGQIGLEASPAEYVARLVDVFREVRRVLRPDGVLWLNLGDSYSTRKVVRDSSHQPGFHPTRTDHATIGKSWAQNAAEGNARMPSSTGVPEKNMLGVPWRVAVALQDDGWILRNDVIWSKPNAMPESVTDRLSSRHEHLFLLTRSPRYAFNLDPIREPTVYPTGASALNWARDSKEADVPGQSTRQHRSGRTHGKAAGSNLRVTGQRHTAGDPNRGRNPGDHWEIDETHLTDEPRFLSHEDAAYIAAFIDGEGSICIRRRTKQIQLMLTVVNTHEQVLRWMCERTGMGTVRQREVRNERWRQVWEWNTTSRQAAQVIYAVLDHLRVKRTQALLALRFMETTRVAGGGAASDTYHAQRLAMAEDLSALNAGTIVRSDYALPAVRPQTSSRGDVWNIPTAPYPGAHFATMPPALARRCILAGSRDGDTVLDPFTGSGTTGMLARSLGRRFVGVDLSADYLDLAVQRIGEPPLIFDEPAAPAQAAAAAVQDGMW